MKNRFLFYMTLMLFPFLALGTAPEFVENQIDVHYDLRSTRTGETRGGDKTISDRGGDGWLFGGGVPGVPHFLFRRLNQFASGKNKLTNVHLFWVNEIFGIWWPWNGHLDNEWIGTVRVTGQVTYRIPKDCHFIQAASFSHYSGRLTAMVYREGISEPLTMILNHPSYFIEEAFSQREIKQEKLNLIIPDISPIPDFLDLGYPPFSDLDFYSKPYLGHENFYPLSLSRRSIIPVKTGDTVVLKLEFDLERDPPQHKELAQKESFGAISVREIGIPLFHKELLSPDSYYYEKETKLHDYMQRLFCAVDYKVEDNLQEILDKTYLHGVQYSYHLINRLLFAFGIIDRLQSEGYQIGSKNSDLSMRLRNLLVQTIDQRDVEHAKLYAFHFLGKIDQQRDFREEREKLDPLTPEDVKQMYNKFLETHPWIQNVVNGTEDNTYLSEIDSHLLRILVKKQESFLKPKLQHELDIIEHELLLYAQIVTLLNTLEITLVAQDSQGALRVLNGLKKILQAIAESNPEIQDNLAPLVQLIDHYNATQIEVPMGVEAVYSQVLRMEEIVEKRTVRMTELKSWIDDIDTWKKLNRD